MRIEEITEEEASIISKNRQGFLEKLENGRQIRFLPFCDLKNKYCQEGLKKCHHYMEYQIK